MRFKGYLILVCAFGLFAFHSSNVFELKYPSHFDEPDYNFSKNPLTQKKIDLGRALFYDPILSADNTISCASCHSSYNAFAHTDHDLSHGINDQIGKRNAPSLINLAWQKSFMWDGAIEHLDMQALAPISDSTEMGESMVNVIRKLNQSDLYKKLFWKAFGDSTATGEYALKAISQFQLTLVSATSKYDLVQQGEDSFTEQELKGYSVFKASCSSCHTEPMFTNDEFKNNGLPIDTSLNDFGRGAITGIRSDSLLFKVPSLRNLSFTYPYMHDGRFQKLGQVLNHYTKGIIEHSTLSPELKDGLHLAPEEKVDLIAFLLTLNDRSFVFNPKHQFPKEILMPGE